MIFILPPLSSSSVRTLRGFFGSHVLPRSAAFSPPSPDVCRATWLKHLRLRLTPSSDNCNSCEHCLLPHFIRSSPRAVVCWAGSICACDGAQSPCCLCWYLGFPQKSWRWADFSLRPRHRAALRDQLPSAGFQSSARKPS